MPQLIFLEALILIIWFNTEVLIEYLKLLKLNIFYIEEYEKAKLNDFSLTYHKYLIIYHNNFFTRLITCPICFNFWMSIILSLSCLSLFPQIFIVSLAIYYTLNKIGP
jgi:hypothetical protein